MQQVPFQYVFAAAGLFGVAAALVFSRVQLQDSGEEVKRTVSAGIWQTLRDDRAYRGFLAGFFAFGFGAWLMAPAIPILLVDVLRATNFQVGLLGAVTSGTAVLAYYQWGKLIDRRTAPGALIIAFLTGTLTPLIYLIAVSPWIVLPAGVTDGFTSAGVDLGWLTAVLQYAPAGLASHYVAIYNTLVGIRGSTAPFLTGLLIPRIGVRAVFGIAAAFTLGGVWMMRRVAVFPGRPGGSGSGETRGGSPT